MPWFWVFVALVAVCAAYGLHRVALWAEGRGWIYYKTKGKGGVGMSLIGQIYQPSIEHVVDEEQSSRIKADQDDAGEGDDPTSHFRSETTDEE